MRSYIDINKELIPYSITIPLEMDVFTMSVEYNAVADMFTVGLSKSGEVLVEAEAVVYGVPLFRDIYRSGKFPAVDIVPYDESGTYDYVSWENLNDYVKLTIDSGGAK